MTNYSKKQELNSILDLFDIQDIFLDLRDNNLYVSKLNTGSATSMNGRLVITDPDDFGIKEKVIDSCSIKLKVEDNEGIIVDDEFFSNLNNSIGHMESKYKLKLDSIFYRTTSNLWVSSISELQKYFTKLNNRDMLNKQKYLLYIDIIFEIL